jgi:cellulose synthase operon protein C
VIRRPLAQLALLVGIWTAPASAFLWPTTVERIEQGLRSPDVSVRQKAAEELGQLSPALGQRLVLRALEDSDSEVRLRAAHAARELRVAGAGERVIGWLNDPERRVRIAACEVLRASPTQRAVGVLGRVLGDPDGDVRIAAVEALAVAGTSDAAVALLGHLDDGLPQVRRAVVSALGALSDRRAVVPLIGKIQDPNAQVRRSVAQTLGLLGDRRAASALILALRDNDESVRIAALEALGELHAAEAIMSISASVERDTSPSVRAAALSALSRIASSEALTALMRALGSDDAELVEASRAALVRVGEPAVPPLIECLKGQPALSLAEGCALALGKIRAKKAGAVIASAMGRGVLRPVAGLVALGDLSDPSNLSVVLERLSDVDPLVRKSAIEAGLALLDPAQPDGRAVEPIVRALERARSSRAERLALVALLGKTGSPRAALPLIPLVSGADDVQLRGTALEALGALGPVGQDSALLAALDDEEPSVRLAAALALNRSASAAAASPLLDRLERRAEQDRVTLAIALAGALSRTRSAELIDRIEPLMRASQHGERDALIEALGRMPGAGASARLVSLLGRSALAADRAKLAETLASHPEAVRALETLARDVDGAVRANAVWALGAVGDGNQRTQLIRALSDRDVAVSGNALAALARIALRAKTSPRSELCAALADPRSYVRANALAALSVVGERCATGEDRKLLLGDPSEAARRAAALLLMRTPSKAADADRTALRRCVAEEPSGAVAAACADPIAPLKAGTEPVTVYVVPMGEEHPVAQTPFALVLANGLMRLGVTDRRGAVFEAAAPIGPVSLAVPAPLAR